MRAHRNKRFFLLWDESFLWGVMASRALLSAGLPFGAVRASDVRSGALDDCRALLVPGGWASHKVRVLGPDGAARIRRFVEEGGCYVGLCGGAGMATGEALSLLDAKRLPTRERVPSFSGPIRLLLSDDPLWRGVRDPLFHAWWPSQLIVGDDVSVLGRYGEASLEAFSSDLNVGDTIAGGGWEELEADYGINLDPARMLGAPAVVRGRFGRGTVLLSLIHFDSPGSEAGQAVLRNIWRQHGGKEEEKVSGGPASPGDRASLSLTRVRPSLVPLLDEARGAVDGLVELGLRNFLWFVRQPFMLQWRRGVRGLEYTTLKVMMDEIAQVVSGTGLRRASSFPSSPSVGPEETAAETEARLLRLGDVLLPFIREARVLLLFERQLMSRERLTFDACGDPVVRDLREKLFSTAKSHGGVFKEVLDRADEVLYPLLLD